MNRHNRSERARSLMLGALPQECRTVGGSWIAGRWKTGAESFETIDPATGEPLHTVAQASAADIDEAAEAAALAGDRWWSTDGQVRAQIFWRIADGIRSRARELGVLDTLDAGRPIRDTQTRDPERAARIFEYFAGLTDRIRGATIPVQPGMRNATVMEPHGVVGAIIPWNYPLTNAATKLAPALATGNAVILKPAEDTPLSAMLLAEITKEAGLPDGLLSILQGSGDIVGRAIVEHPLVNKIAFTGSTDVGRQIARSAGDSLKSVTLELGGKSAFVVFGDADLDEAAAALVFSLLNNQGQTCTAATRLLAPRHLADALLDRITAIAATIRVGDPLDPATLVGPLVSKGQFDRVSRYVELGRQEGAEAIPLHLDRRLDGLGGFFPDPLVFRSVSPRMRIHCEEIFGPILVMLTFDDEEEALAIANGTDYGLSSSIWTNDLRRAERLSARIESGLVWINTVHSLHPGSPYGGFRQSGIGSEMGTEAVSQFMKTKSIWTAVEPYRSPWGPESAGQT